MMIEKATLAVIGGSGTLAGDFPRGLGDAGVEVLADNLVYETPYGQSPPFRRFAVAGRPVLTCRMHGWRSGVSRGDASRQVFWVLREAGVRRIIAEGGVGSVNRLLDPLDIVVPDDYIDLSLRKDVGLEGKYLLVMRDALCPEIRAALRSAAELRHYGRVFGRGVYAVTEGRHVESPAEVAMLQGHADIVGQSLCPEVYLAREIGACYAGVYLVVNYGEGVVKAWSHQTLKEIFHGEAALMGRVVLAALRDLPDEGGCGCAGLRKETLLTDIYK